MPRIASAQSANRTLLTISESGANSVDPHVPGANRGSYEVAWNCYDRLLSLKIEKDENGVDHANATKPAPELAEEWNDAAIRSPSSCARMRPSTTARPSRRRT
jgi:peptide/nickel transport system substrate-binding protein